MNNRVLESKRFLNKQNKKNPLLLSVNIPEYTTNLVYNQEEICNFTKHMLKIELGMYWYSNVLH